MSGGGMWPVLLAVRLAAQAQPGIDSYAPLINLGAVGFICAVLIVFARTTVADLRAQRDTAQEDARRKTRIVELERVIADLRKELDKTQEDLVDLNREARAQMIPAMVASTQVMSRVVNVLDNWRQGGPT